MLKNNENSKNFYHCCISVEGNSHYRFFKLLAIALLSEPIIR